MSKKRISKRLENIFADVAKEAVSPEPGSSVLPGGAGEPRLPDFITHPPASDGEKARGIQSAPRPVSPTTGRGSGDFGIISTAFQQDEKTWATLRLVDERASHAWSDQEQMLVSQVADQLSLALENARLFEEAQRSGQALQHQNERLAAAAEIGRLVTSTLDIETILERTVRLVSERFGFYHAALFLVDDTATRLVMRAATGDAGAKLKTGGYSLPLAANSIVGEVALGRPAAVVNNTSEDSSYQPNPLLPRTQAACALPLRVGERIIGALDIQSMTTDAFQPDDLSALQILADQVAIAIDNARSYGLAQQAVKEMRELDRVKTQFLANMSHELRTPLNSIIGFSRVILKGIDGPISELQQQDLSAIYNAGQHLLGLINDVLDLAKIEAGKMDITLAETRLPEIITGVMSTAAGLVRDKPIRLLQRVPEDLPSVRADAIRVRQVLLNLLSNAAKFTEEGEIIVWAAAEARSDGTSQVRVSVTDTGPGISAEDQTKLFQAFSQVDDSPTRKTGGSGLGLSISQQLVQLQGGRIGVESSPGQGSTFFFTLPVYEPESTGTAGTERKVVLAVDDDPQVIKLYQRSLESQGYQVLGVTDATRAEQMARERKPFAITLDIMMPGVDGWQVLTALKQNEKTRDIPVIICSILEQQERGFRLGAADYVLKPILGDGLINALDRLGRTRGTRELLIVDDDPESLSRLDRVFQSQTDYRRTLASSGAEAWQRMTDHTPDAIVLDAVMPDTDSFMLLDKIRGSEALGRVPIIVVSDAELSPEQQSRLANLGHRHVRKGMSNEGELLEAVKQSLEQTRP
jgi:signal transduction histidine kinase/DNA-binding response OmpR family regulator